MQRPTLLGCLAAAAFTLGGVSAMFGASYVYVSTNPDGPNALEGYSRDTSTGLLTHIGRYDTGGTGDPFVGGFEQHSVVSHGKYVYVVNAGSDTISALKVKADGSLKLVNQVPSGGRRPVALTTNGKFLYVANEGNPPGDTNPLEASYSGFTVAKDGSLTGIPNSTISAGVGVSLADINLSADGKMLVGDRLFGNRIDSFIVKSNGKLVRQRTSLGCGGPFGASFNPARPDQLLVTLAVPELFDQQNAPGVTNFKVDTTDATIGAMATYTDPAGVDDTGFRDPCWVTFMPDGNHFVISSFIPRMLTAFAVEKKGYISRLSSYQPGDVETVPNLGSIGNPTTTAVLGSIDIKIDAQGKYLYQARVFSVPDGAIPLVPRIHVFSLTGDFGTNAGLSQVQAINMPDDLAGSGVMGLTIVEH